MRLRVCSTRVCARRPFRLRLDNHERELQWKQGRAVADPRTALREQMLLEQEAARAKRMAEDNQRVHTIEAPAPVRHPPPAAAAVPCTPTYLSTL